jgi:hypothetical protein
MKIRSNFTAKIAVIALALYAVGCGMQLETGYQYRPLNASTADRRAYYAPAFSPEKSAAEQGKSAGPAPSFNAPH